MCDLRKSGIHTPADLVRFPWDGKEMETSAPSDEEIEEMRKRLRELNKEAEKKKYNDAHFDLLG